MLPFGSRPDFHQGRNFPYGQEQCQWRALSWSAKGSSSCRCLPRRACSQSYPKATPLEMAKWHHLFQKINKIMFLMELPCSKNGMKRLDRWLEGLLLNKIIIAANSNENFAIWIVTLHTSNELHLILQYLLKSSTTASLRIKPNLSETRL